MHLFPVTLVSRNIWLTPEVSLITASAQGPHNSKLVVSTCRQSMDSQAAARGDTGN